MSYNKAREERKWKKCKEKEERILRQEGKSESKIMELRQYDRKLFNADRRFKEKQFTNGQLMDYEDYSNQEISSILGLNETIIRKRIYDVRKKLDK